jgi:DNA processing protein
MDDPELWIALRDVPRLGLAPALALIDRFGSPSGVFRARSRDLAERCSPALVRALERGPRLRAAREELRLAARLGIRTLPQDAPDFPPRLLEIPDPPLVLYAVGAACADTSPACVAMVGSRKPSARARETARALATAAARAGCCVVSGLAYGLDAEAHEGALAGSGATVAVLASGLDRPSPLGNRGLARRILDAGGGWLSEHPPRAPAHARHFPFRNRLISGLARLVVIVEARERSGSLWTARHAADQGRDVAAVPGPVDTDLCRGSNRLLREGAIPILDADDLLDELFPGRARASSSGPVAPLASPEGGRVLQMLREGPAEADGLARRLGLSAPALAGALLELELSGYVTRRGSRVALSAKADRR